MAPTLGGGAPTYLHENERNWTGGGFLAPLGSATDNFTIMLKILKKSLIWVVALTIAEIEICLMDFLFDLISSQYLFTILQ